jgi:hypothetical protein
MDPRRTIAVLGLHLAISAVAVSAAAQQYTVSTLAGGILPTTPAAATGTSIGAPGPLTADARGNVYFTALNGVYTVDTKGTLTRIAGTLRTGFSGDSGPANN